MRFIEACVLAVNSAKSHDVVYYVHNKEDEWDVTRAFKKGWLFKVYPGGRKIISIDGKNILKTSYNEERYVGPDVDIRERHQNYPRPI